MAMRATRPRADDAFERAAIAERRAAYRARLIRHERLVVAGLGFAIASTIVGALAIARAAGA